MKKIIVLSSVLLIVIASCTAPSGHKSQSWHPGKPEKMKAGHNH